MPAPGHRAPVVARLVALVVSLAVVVGCASAPAALAADDAPGSGATEQTVTVPVRAEPDGSAVTLDATVFVPGSPGPHPAVLLAHGFGGSKADLVDRARDLADRGYVVLTYSARGFGASGGRIHLDDPDYEVADGRTLVDLLAARPDVRLDGAGDPRVGVAGGSYGGALALMLGATDKRVDAVVASITWNDLAEAFFPQHVDDRRPRPRSRPSSNPSPRPARSSSSGRRRSSRRRTPARHGPERAGRPPHRCAAGSTRPSAASSSARPSRDSRALSCWPCCAPTAHARCSPGSPRRPTWSRAWPTRCSGSPRPTRPRGR